MKIPPTSDVDHSKDKLHPTDLLAILFLNCNLVWPEDVQMVVQSVDCDQPH